MENFNKCGQLTLIALFSFLFSNHFAQSSCPTDLDDDGVTNTSDFLLFATEFAKGSCDPGLPCRADYNGDSYVNTVDFLTWASSFNWECPSISSLINTVGMDAPYLPDVLHYIVAGSPGTEYTAGSEQRIYFTRPATGATSNIELQFYLNDYATAVAQSTLLRTSFDIDHYGNISQQKVYDLNPATGVFEFVALYPSYGTVNSRTIIFDPILISDLMPYPGFPNYGLVAALFTCLNDANKNFTETTVFDENGYTIAGSRSYTDYLGKPTQSQSKNITESKIVCAQTIYDAFGRPAISTLPAIIDEAGFCYQDNFVSSNGTTPYSYLDFDVPNYTANSALLTLGEVDQPKALDNSAALISTLGWYYSDNNTLEPYVASGSFPYYRTEYDDNNLGRVRRSAMAGDSQLKMGSGHEAQVYTMATTTDELRLLFDQMPPYYTGILYYSYLSGATKTIQVDANGVETITYHDTEGNTIATCLSEKTNNPNGMYCESAIIPDNSGNYNGSFVDIHLPLNNSFLGLSCGGTGTGNSVLNIMNLKTGKYETINGSVDITVAANTYFLISNLASGFYRIICKTAAPGTTYIGTEYELPYYNFSIYNYDGANRLRYSLPPIAISASNYNAYKSTYTYNSLGQTIQTQTPDEGITKYVYRNDGQLRFSQNALQKLTNKFAYVNYDASGRTTESGEYDPALSGTGAATSFDTHFASLNEIPITLDPARCTQQSNIAYDVADVNFYTLTGLSSTAYKQDFLLGKVSFTTNADSKMWYCYDELGRLAWTVQRIENMPTSGQYAVKTINYSYDLNGNVTEIAFQKETAAESFYHYYQYDADKRLKKVLTSLTPALSQGEGDEQAEYFYYLHGPLKRVELANKLQGVDYVYTINGWLKGINAPELDNRDPGKDAKTRNKSYSSPADLFGMTLDYYAGDYSRNNSMVQTYAPTTGAVTNDLFNGIIKAQRWQTKSAAIGGLQHNNNQLMYGYQYDKKYQLTQATFGEITSPGYLNCGTCDLSTGYNGPVLATSNDYQLPAITYDDNGNILTLNRKGILASGLNTDQLTYQYITGSNKLQRVSDAITANNYGSSIEILTGQATNNYTYDAIGQLTADVSGANYNNYNAYGQVTGVFSDAAKTTALANFVYDEKGFRLKKNSPGNIDTWYVRDAFGNLMSIYKKDGATLTQSEQHIYGMGRMGVFNKTSNEYIYEHTDHLGNVRNTFTQQKDYTISTDFNETSGDDEYLFDYTYVTIDNTKDASGGAGSSVYTGGSGAGSTTTYIPYETSTTSLAELPQHRFFGTFITIPVTAGQIINANIKYFYSPVQPPVSMGAGLKYDLWQVDAATGTPTLLTENVLGSITTQYGIWNTLTAPAYTVPASGSNLMLRIYPKSTSITTRIWWDKLNITITPNGSGEGGIDKPILTTLSDYYPHGGIMPGRNYSAISNYRWGYQGQFSEKDPETGQNSFELRNYDARLGRFLTTDPYGQFHSSYNGMGNDPVNMMDEDGGWGIPGGFMWIAKYTNNGIFGTALHVNFSALIPDIGRMWMGGEGFLRMILTSAKYNIMTMPTGDMETVERSVSTVKSEYGRGSQTRYANIKSKQGDKKVVGFRSNNGGGSGDYHTAFNIFGGDFNLRFNDLFHPFGLFGSNITHVKYSKLNPNNYDISSKVLVRTYLRYGKSDANDKVNKESKLWKRLHTIKK